MNLVVMLLLGIILGAASTALAVWAWIVHNFKGLF